MHGTMNLKKSTTTVARGLARCKLYLMDVQEVRWDKGGTVRAGDYIFIYMEKETKTIDR
jgi:hypothetical protein